MFVGELESLIKGWNFVCVDAIWKSGGLLLGWKIRNF